MLEMKRFAEARGFKATGYRGLSIDNLSKLRWVIVPLEVFGGGMHFAVVVGVNGPVVDLADPCFGRRRTTVSYLTKRWYHGLALVIQSR